MRRKDCIKNGYNAWVPHVTDPLQHCTLSDPADREAWLEGWQKANAEYEENMAQKENEILDNCPWNALGTCSATNTDCSQNSCAVLYLLNRQ